MIKRKFFYGWALVVLGFVVFALGYGVRYSFSVIFPSLLDTFQWSRSATAVMMSFQFLAYGFAAPVAGALVDRYGARKTISVGAVLLALGTVISAFSNSLWQFYISFGIVAGVGLCLIGSVPFTRLISNWFVRRRGLALGILFFGVGGSFVMSLGIAFLIEQLGWRWALIIEGGVVGAVTLAGALFIVRNAPSDIGMLPDGEMLPVSGTAPQKTGEEIKTSKVVLSAISNYRFWAICLCAFTAWGIAEQIMISHHVAYAQGVGFSKIYAASVLSLFGVFLSIGSIAGFISDKIGREGAFTVAAVLAIVGLAVLMFVRGTGQAWMMYIYAGFFGLGIGITQPAIAAAATDIFQGKGAGTMIGFVWLAFALGGAVGPWLGGVIFEKTGTYIPAFLTSAGMLVIAAAAMWVAAPRKGAAT